MTGSQLKPDWKMVEFGDIAQNVAVRVDPADAKTDVYVGLEHLDPSTLAWRAVMVTGVLDDGALRAVSASPPPHQPGRATCIAGKVSC